MLTKTLLVLITFLQTNAAAPSRADLGYATGYIPDCPGVNKTAIITKHNLKYLGFIVQGLGSPFTAKRKRYGYYQMAELAKDPDVDFKRKTLIYVLGYTEPAHYPIPWTLGKVYKDLGYNVIVLDINRYTTTYYPVASRLMRAVGLRTAEALLNLTKYGLNPKKLELIGVSLGGQTISFIAKNFYKLSGTKVSRLTGLDPAGPCFRNMGPEDRLDKSDADFVESVHTNIDGYGMAYPMGHVSYYVNGGEYQIIDVEFLPCMDLCSHVRSYILWHTALKNPKKFVAIKCDSVQQARNYECYDRKPLDINYLGLFANKNKPGIYFLSTTYTFPYYLEMNGTKKEFNLWSQPALYNKEDVLTM
ncbi:Lipase member H-A [Eumeta japonica]|uniref:Lipase member H-A n=1 Tax=Eumeta variegata TaxID=151549 RepID=A0A4C1UDU1_EUMVA|nr:Lipase member H-A [Eumeta japonica]